MRKEQINIPPLPYMCSEHLSCGLKFCFSKIIVPRILNAYFKDSIEMAWLLRAHVLLETPVQFLASTSSRSYLTSDLCKPHVYVCACMKTHTHTITTI